MVVVVVTIRSRWRGTQEREERGCGYGDAQVREEARVASWGEQEHDSSMVSQRKSKEEEDRLFK